MMLFELCYCFADIHSNKTKCHGWKHCMSKYNKGMEDRFLTCIFLLLLLRASSYISFLPCKY